MIKDSLRAVPSNMQNEQQREPKALERASLREERGNQKGQQGRRSEEGAMMECCGQTEQEKKGKRGP